jgi:propanol-preferring alcohol dehydrogenase
VGEREICSVTNTTRADAGDFLELAPQLKLTPAAHAFPLAAINDALRSVEGDTIDGSAVITMT